jgi:hypothetical protein
MLGKGESRMNCCRDHFSRTKYCIYFSIKEVKLLLYQRWKSQRKKIHRQAYRFSIDFKIYRLAYGFLSVNHKGLAKVYRFLVGAFFSQDFKNP